MFADLDNRRDFTLFHKTNLEKQVSILFVN